jgi:hypothetical protein
MPSRPRLAGADTEGMPGLDLLRFAWLGRVSTKDMQGPRASLIRQHDNFARAVRRSAR